MTGKNNKKPGFRTKSVHTGVYQDGTFNSVTTPIYPSSTFYFDALGKHRGYDYTRSGNPTRTALEANIAALEGGTGACATATGMAAVTTALLLLQSGDHVITGDDIYGGSYRLFDQLLPGLGITFSFVNMRDIKAVRAALRPQTKMIWIETPSNPLLNIVDLEATIGFVKEHGLLSAVDNTFMTPYFQKPFAFGADLVVHSTTKYINGHSDVVGGAVVFNDEKLGEKVRYVANGLGVTESPFDAWLVLRGVKSLAARMEAHQANAMAVAQFLKEHGRVKKVYYPGLPEHPQYDLVQKQMTGTGGMLSFDLDTSQTDLDCFFAKLRYFRLAESLGGVESLIEHPWSMSHSSMGENGLKKSGITPETIRISIGIEEAGDLMDDLDQALHG